MKSGLRALSRRLRVVPSASFSLCYSCLHTPATPATAADTAFRNVLNLCLKCGGFPGGAGVENLPANAGDTGSSPGLGRSHMPQSN